ncbi:zinc transporter ZIP3 [Episyrphus balteatus]|uniref:zinc transporter ZIP3 n=1 Tax=Episyrphus balteatus TaxID=286459 RepID=UPI002484DDF7|nr:zinc transporter ZIP3 [Episyrphus balteatus]
MESNVTDSSSDGNGAKILAMTSLGLGSFIFGMLPAAISERNRRRFPFCTSLMLCFGAGILLATAMVHMLPDVRRTMPNNAEVYFCVGFFFVYFIDEFIHYFFGEAIQHSHSESSGETNSQHQHSHSHNNYGSNNESEPLVRPNTSRCAENEKVQQCETVIRQANERICHTSHREPCVQSMTGAFGLFVALSLHSFVEGLAIGVQNSGSKVLFLLGAVACHKLVMGFCLGLEFRSNPRTNFQSQLLAILVFSLGSVIGIGVGMAFVNLPSSWSGTALPIIQALAGGTLFYVTVCEVMPREKARWHQKPERRTAGLAQFVAVGLGFTVMTIINFYIGDD